MASLIDEALPDFVNRKGGFPDDYLKTLAANALDYADKDNEPTIASGVRGLDAYPLVSEFLMTFRWDKIATIRGRKNLVLSVSTYVELWNMSDREVSGKAKISYETGYNFKVGADPNGISLGDMTNAAPKLESEDGHHWFPAFDVSLRPNEYHLYNCGTLTFTYDLGSVYVLEPLELSGDAYGLSGSGYRLKWKDSSMDNFALVDQSRGAVHRNDSDLYYNEKNKQKRKQTRCTIPSHSHTISVSNWRNNMGDSRMSFYNQSPQDANAYPENYSPNRRNVRLRIYRGNNGTSTIYARVMPSEWPDGGHNSEFGSASFYTEDDNIEADDARFFTSLPAPIAEEAPMRISNLGRFYSATELGRTYDPIMWNVAPPATKNGPWGDVETTTKSSTEYGGGNSLRIGRPEHPAFRISSSPGKEAWRLLDLFHTGQPLSDDADEREGDLIRIDGHVNLNTATRDTLRAVVIGALKMDPAIEYRTNDNHNTTTKMAPPTSIYEATDSQIVSEANTIADAIIDHRASKPFASAAESAGVLWNGKPVFGNLDLVTDKTKIQRSDSASEELFARVYESSTVRSRNFRIWVVAQAVSPTSTTNTNPNILAEVRRQFTVFHDPGERNSDGAIDPANARLIMTHENDF
ncbi:MAG: hypothetical protein KDN05_17935, partial [Verrucomicrobiae bacterium]|nr:hypothetical protein [Verrucomicrobiae bacterium]